MARYRTTISELMKQVYKEDGHQDVSSSKRMCRTIVEDAQQIETKLNVKLGYPIFEFKKNFTVCMFD